MTRKYGRKIPAPLPRHMMLSRISPALPLSVDLRASCGPVKDQGNEGSCTAHSGTSAVEWIFRKYLGKQPVFSPQYTYAQELIAQGDFPNDTGSEGVTLCLSLIGKGCCGLALYPYVSGDILRPTPEQDSNASGFRMGAYHGLTGSDVAMSVLGDPTPWPVEIGFTVYQSFEGNALASSGVMPLPKTGEYTLGGHEVLLVGYDLAYSPIIRPAKCPPAFLVQNSWGTDWGLGGFFWMPKEILDAGDTDLKIVHAGPKW